MQDYGTQEYCPFCGAPTALNASDRGQMPVETILNRRFIIGEPLGKDRIGFTYIAWDALLERRVLVKEWFPVKLAKRGENHLDVEFFMEEERSKKLKEDFLEQARKLHRLQIIPVLIPIYTFFEENNTAYYIMEYTEGETIREILQKTNPLEVQRVQVLLKKVREALEVLHRNGLIHGNLSPENILFAIDGTVRFLNLAWFGEGMEELKYTVFAGRYASPCYYEGTVKPDRSMDLYSMAAVAYRMLTGEEPVSADKRTKKEGLVPISDYGIEIPAQMENDILQTMGVKKRKENVFLRFLQGMNVILLLGVIALGVAHLFI